MSLPLSIFLYIYFVFLVLWLIFSLVGVYHMLKFGFLSFATFFFTFAYIAVSVLILLVSTNYILGIDWEANIQFFNFLNNPNNNIFFQ